MRKKTFIILVIIAALVAAGIIFWNRKKSPDADSQIQPQESQKNYYEALVMVRDEINPDPVADKKFSLKAGDVIAVLPGGHPWSETERISYLILKLDISDEMAQKLTQPEEKIIPPASPEDDEETETIRARRYRLKIETLDLNPDAIDNQKFEDKIFDESIVEEKK